jgi:hypothetical protein
VKLPKKHKFHAQPQKTDDGFFASKAELRRWQALQLRAAAKDIHELTRQPEFPLWTMNLAGQRVPVKIGNREAKYVADFAYHEDGAYVVEDVKGVDTAMGKLKRAIVKASLGIDVRLITKGGQQWNQTRRPSSRRQSP